MHATECISAQSYGDSATKPLLLHVPDTLISILVQPLLPDSAGVSTHACWTVLLQQRLMQPLHAIEPQWLQS